MLTLTPSQLADLEAAATRHQHNRSWKRYQALILLAHGETFREVAKRLKCGESTVYRWVTLWRTEGVTGLEEGPHLGRARLFDCNADDTLDALLFTDPRDAGYRAMDWTVPLLLEELRARGWTVSEQTLRRSLKRLGYRWQRPRFVRETARTDPETID